MLTIENIEKIEGNVVTIKRLDWKIIGVTDYGPSQYQFYLKHGSNFRTIYLDRTIENTKDKNIYNKNFYRLHTSQNARYVSAEELRSVGSTLYWFNEVCN
jgi:hypothetical protein